MVRGEGAAIAALTGLGAALRALRATLDGCVEAGVRRGGINQHGRCGCGSRDRLCGEEAIDEERLPQGIGAGAGRQLGERGGRARTTEPEGHGWKSQCGQVAGTGMRWMWVLRAHGGNRLAWGRGLATCPICGGSIDLATLCSRQRDGGRLKLSTKMPAWLH